MRDKIILFGAGNNCRGIIKFLGKEWIYAIIDNDIRRWGTKVEGIDVISFQDFLSQDLKHPILITVASIKKCKEIKRQLKAAGIKDYHYAPFVQNGFFNDIDDLIERVGLKKIDPVFYGNDPISESIIEKLEQQKIDHKILEPTEEENVLFNRRNRQDDLITEEELAPDQVIVVTCAKEHDLGRFSNRVIDIEDEYKTKYLKRHDELKQFKDIHKGKRCFLIGNGPSLSYRDLDKLKENREITFGVNRIYLGFDKTEWRPDYYVIVDSIVLQQDYEIVKGLDLPVIFISDNYTEDEINDHDNLFYFSRRLNQYDIDSFSLDISQYIFTGNTVIYDSMQIAAYMGFKEIILLGVDMTYAKPGEKIAHFYNSDIKNEASLVQGNFEESMKVFSIARNVTEKMGIKLLNATRGGDENVLERVDFDRLFEHTQ